MDETSGTGASTRIRTLDVAPGRRSARMRASRATTRWFVAALLLVPLLAADPRGIRPCAPHRRVAARARGKPVDPAPACRRTHSGQGRAGTDALRVRKLLAADDRAAKTSPSREQRGCGARRASRPGGSAVPRRRARAGGDGPRRPVRSRRRAGARRDDLARLTMPRAPRGRRASGRACGPAAPDDPTVLYWAADITARQRSIELLERYLARASANEDRIASRRHGARCACCGTGRSPRVGTAGASRAPRATPRPAVGSDERADARLHRRGAPGSAQADAPPAGQRQPGTVRARAHRPQEPFAPLAETTSFGGGGDRRHATSRGILPELDLGGLRFADPCARRRRTSWSRPAATTA